MPKRTISLRLWAIGTAAFVAAPHAGAAFQESGRDIPSASPPRSSGPPPKPEDRGGPGGPPGGFGPGAFLAEEIIRIADADKDGRLSPEEAGNAAERFIREADSDRRGSLDVQGLEQAIGGRMGRPPGPGRGSLDRGGPPGGPGGFLGRQILQGADTDKDGRLSPEEARTAAKRLIQEIDEGGKGSIDRESLIAAINQRISPPEGFGGPGGPPGMRGPDSQAPLIMKYADANADGRLSPAEAAAAAARFVRESGADDDGMLAFEPLMKAIGGGFMMLGDPEHPPRGHGPGDMQAIQVMELFDTDRDDHLAPEEAAQVAERLVREADKGGKGSIDLDDLKGALNRALGSPFGPRGPRRN